MRITASLWKMAKNSVLEGVFGMLAALRYLSFETISPAMRLSHRILSFDLRLSFFL